MSTALTAVACSIFDFRGRTSRKAYWLAFFVAVGLIIASAILIPVIIGYFYRSLPAELLNGIMLIINIFTPLLATSRSSSIRPL